MYYLKIRTGDWKQFTQREKSFNLQRIKCKKKALVLLGLSCTRLHSCPHCMDKSSRVVILRTFLECVSRGNNASLYFLASYGGSKSKRLKEALMHDPSVRKVFSEHWGGCQCGVPAAQWPISGWFVCTPATRDGVSLLTSHQPAA